MNPYPRVCYEIFVRSFCDSNGDGIGDINGITSQLDYFVTLGVEGLWLTPIHPSPSYHKYDVVDYYEVDPEYGTLEDFKRLLTEAHARGIHVYLDLVIHHTSVLHPWFLQAKENRESPYRGFYRWMSVQQIEELGLDVRETTDDAHTVNPWHRVKGEKERFLGIFSRDMADLNFDNPLLKEEIYKIAAFWLNEVGVDGFRLDAARHIYPIWEDDKNPLFWEEFGKEVERLKPGAYLVGEVWADTHRVAPFFKGLKANFNFALCERLEQVLLTGDDQGLIAWIQEQRRVFADVNPEFIDALMLSNHDQQRIGSTLRANTSKMKLAAAIFLTLPGQPYLYYGEELGMLGKKPDPFIREPFLWGEDALETNWRAPRYSKPGKVESLRKALCDPCSLYYCYRTLIHLRKTFQALGAVCYTGIEDAGNQDPHLLAYIRKDNDSAFLVVHNLKEDERTLALTDTLAGFRIVRYATNSRFLLSPNELRLDGFNSVVLQLEDNKI